MSAQWAVSAMKTLWSSSPSSFLSWTTDSSFHGSTPPAVTKHPFQDSRSVVSSCHSRKLSWSFWQLRKSNLMFCFLSLLVQQLSYFTVSLVSSETTVDIKNPVSVWVHSAVVAVGEGDTCGEGMLGNPKHLGTEFSLSLQGQHPWEWTGDVLAGLIYKHKHTDRGQTWVSVCVFMCVSVCVRESLCDLQKPNSVQVW